MPQQWNLSTGRLDNIGIKFIVLDHVPTGNDFQYAVGTEAQASTTGDFYKLRDNTFGAAVWERLSPEKLDFYDSVISIADASIAPPTENFGDRYILDANTPVHADWDGATNADVVEYNGVNWIASTPTAGSFAYVEDVQTLYIYDGSWLTVNAAIPHATTTVVGITRYSTNDENKAGTVNDAATTPASISSHLADEQQSGFLSWDGAGSYYTVSGSDFTVDRGGSGWIDSRKISWLAGQTVSSLSVGATHYIYMDSTGTIGSTTSRNTDLFRDNVVLFEVFVDNSGVPNIIVVKENHSISTNPETMNALHELGAHGYSVNAISGGTISLNGSAGLQVDGDSRWWDHDLMTLIPDSSATAVDLNICHTDAGGKWVIAAVQNTLPLQWNDGGTPTLLAGNEHSIYDIRVSKDDLETANPQYIAVMGSTLYANLAQAETARDERSFTTATNELEDLETIRMGIVIVDASGIADITVAKQTMAGGEQTFIGSSGASVSIDPSGFDAWLTAAETTAQALANRVDELGKDSVFTLQSSSDATAKVDFDLSLISTATTRTLTLPDQDLDFDPVTGDFRGTIKWAVASSTPQAMLTGWGYITDNGASLTEFTLPTSPTVDAISKILGKSSGGWIVTQSVGEQISLNGNLSTSGATGNLMSTAATDSCTLKYDNDGTWHVMEPCGNLTVN